MFGYSELYLQLAGRLVVPTPDWLVQAVTGGTVNGSFSFWSPGVIPAGTDLDAQEWLVDATGPAGLDSGSAFQMNLQGKQLRISDRGPT